MDQDEILPIDLKKSDIRKKWDFFMTNQHCKNKEIIETYKKIFQSNQLKKIEIFENKIQLYLKVSPEWKLLEKKVILKSDGTTVFKINQKKAKTLEEEMQELEEEWNLLSSSIKLFLIGNLITKIHPMYEKFNVFIEHLRNHPDILQEQSEKWFENIGGFFDMNDYNDKTRLHTYSAYYELCQNWNREKEKVLHSISNENDSNDITNLKE